jgi:hypothetical protein
MTRTLRRHRFLNRNIFSYGEELVPVLFGLGMGIYGVNAFLTESVLTCQRVEYRVQCKLTTSDIFGTETTDIPSLLRAEMDKRNNGDYTAYRVLLKVAGEAIPLTSDFRSFGVGETVSKINTNLDDLSQTTFVVKQRGEPHMIGLGILCIAGSGGFSLYALKKKVASLLQRRT